MISSKGSMSSFEAGFQAKNHIAKHLNKAAV
jgi:hypothetical protein